MDPSRGGLGHHPHPGQHPHHHHQQSQHQPDSSTASSCNSSRRPSIHELSHGHLAPPPPLPSTLSQPPTNQEPYHPGLLLQHHHPQQQQQQQQHQHQHQHQHHRPQHQHHQPQPQPQPLGFFAESQSQYIDAPHVQHFGLNQYYPISTDSSTTPDASNFPFSYTSPRSTVSDPIIPTQPLLQEESPEAPRRRRENRYRNAPPGVLSRRRAQNRASQRAYRERKEQRIRDLEQLLRESTQREQSISQAYVTLQAECARHRAEHHRDTSGSPSSPLSQQHPHDLGAMNAPAAFGPPAAAAAAVEEADDAPGDFHLHMMASYPHHM